MAEKRSSLSSAMKPRPPVRKRVTGQGSKLACVDGSQAANYRFTSALPVSILKLLAPPINARLAGRTTEPLHARTAPTGERVRIGG